MKAPEWGFEILRYRGKSVSEHVHYIKVCMNDSCQHESPLHGKDRKQMIDITSFILEKTNFTLSPHAFVQDLFNLPTRCHES